MQARPSGSSSSSTRAKGPKPVTRDLTGAYVQHRRDRQTVHLHSAGGPGYGHLPATDPLLNAQGGSSPSGNEPRFDRKELPPQWVDSAEEAKETLKAARRKLGELQKAQQRRLLKVFSHDERGDPEVEAISKKISQLLRECEKSIFEVKTRDLPRHSGADAATDAAFRDNVQRGLALELTEVSKEVREAQRSYLQEIQRRAGGGDTGSAAAGSDLEAGKVGGLQAQEVVEVEELERLAASRSDEICQVASAISDLHSMMKDLSAIVIDQGTALDRIDYNMETVFTKGEEAAQQLQQAVQHKRKTTNRAHRALLLLLVLNLISLTVYTVKLKARFGWTFTVVWLCFLGSLVLGTYIVVAWKCPSYRPGFSSESASMVAQDWKDCRSGASTRFTGLKLMAAARFGGMPMR
mmetsp:Transcript_191/g.626  ORF Transcript_191/g.626 Transcript_191/m.626 type:complete len:408 (-) Transcript_191:52-1275(-)